MLGFNNSHQLSNSIDANKISRKDKSPNNEIFIQDNNFMNRTTKQRQEKDLETAFPQTNISYMCMEIKRQEQLTK